MIKSMTAFANSEIKIDNLTLNCELRSVNHRYCDISFKLPESLRYLESDLRSAINSKVKRGKIECAITIKKQTHHESFDIDQQAIKSLLDATGAIEQLMGASKAFSPLDILAFPGIRKETEIDKNTLSENTAHLIKSVLPKLIDAKSREGEKLKELISIRCANIMTLAQEAENRLPLVHTQIREKLLSRIDSLQQEPDTERLEQELLFIAQKMDVAEELDRLQAHVAEVQRLIEQNEAIGRRLDFMMQEMNREANTLASKSQDIKMTQIAIDLKVLIEQMREQIQNIE